MANKTLYLDNITDYSNSANPDVEIALSRDGSTASHHWYESLQYFLFERPDTWTFREMSGSPFTDKRYVKLGVTEKFYFYLASSTDRSTNDNMFDIEPSDWDNILQVRMDVGDIIIIDDGNELINEPLNYLHQTTITVHPNAYGCVTFELPAISFTTPAPTSDNDGEQTVYLIAYSVPEAEGGYKRVQGAICTKNDFRFPAGVDARRVGLELFTDLNKRDSLKSSHYASVDLDIYALKVEELRNNPKFLALFPYFK